MAAKQTTVCKLRKAPSDLAAPEQVAVEAVGQLYECLPTSGQRNY